MITTVKFAKVRPDAKIPTKRVEDAGFDIYPCFDDYWTCIPPHCTAMIPTGIASACDTDYCIVLKERGSTGTKGIAQRSGIVDSGFRGEIKCPITNTTDKCLYIIKEQYLETDGSVFDDNKNKEDSYIIYPYEKAICQALVIPVPEVEVEEYTYDELKAIPSERGTGMLGSSLK